MDIARIPGATRTIGESQGYLGLPLRDEPVHRTVNGPATPSMVTAWLPTPDEIAALMAGAAVHVRILGTTHPPIMLGVGQAGEGEGDNPAPAQEPVAVPAIETDDLDPTRQYITLPGGWEVQTRGKGSSYRLLDRKTGERRPILGSEPQFIQDFVTRMALEVHAASTAVPVSRAADSGEVEGPAQALASAVLNYYDSAASKDTRKGLFDEMVRRAKALASHTPAPQPGEPVSDPYKLDTAPQPGGDEDCLPTIPLQKRVVGTISPSPSQWNAGAEAMREMAAKVADERAKWPHRVPASAIAAAIRALPLPTPAVEG